MVYLIKNTEIKIFPAAQDLFQFAAKDFSQRAITAIDAKGVFSVVLSGGNTPKAFFDILAADGYKIPWQKIQFFFGDERYVPSDDGKSNYHMAYEHLFSKVAVNPDNIYRIPTEFNDPQEAARDYELTLQQVFNLKMPVFDLIYLGLGDNAHTASLMPLSDIVKKYAENSGDKNQLAASVFVAESNMYRITLTPPVINNAKAIIFLVTGADKATAIAEVLQGQTDPQRYPAQLIDCVHGKTLWYLDQTAAGKLKP